MNQTAVTISDDQYERIGEFIRLHFHQWLQEDMKMNGNAASDQLNRIENSLEASIMISREQFKMMDKRFEEQKAVSREHFSLIEKRFELVDKRFEMMERRFDEQAAITRERFEEQKTDTLKHFEAMDRRLQSDAAAMDRRLQTNAGEEKDRFKSLGKRMNRQFTVTTTVTAGLISLIGGILLKVFFG